MPAWVWTLIFSVVLITIALLGMSIGWLLTGRPLKKGCGSKPGAKRSQECGTGSQTCEICDPTLQKKQQEEKRGND